MESHRLKEAPLELVNSIYVVLRYVNKRYSELCKPIPNMTKEMYSQIELEKYQIEKEMLNSYGYLHPYDIA